MSDAIVFDVGHGNCTLVRSEGEFAVVDAPIGDLLMNTLQDFGVTKVVAAFISHADKDHIAGILSLLTSDFVHLERLYINPDSQKDTKVWKELLLAIRIATKKGICKIVPTLTTVHPCSVDIGGARIVVEAPSPALILAGSGSTDTKGRTITSNSISAVLKIGTGSKLPLLLAGDLDEVGLDDATAHERDLSSATLVFPHHGGLPGAGSSSNFASKLLAAVSPTFVIISHGREKHGNPKPQIANAIVRHGCAITCTQLSKGCHATGIFDDKHVENIRAQGRKTGAICGGSMTINLVHGGRNDGALHRMHHEYVTKNVSSPMCR